MSRYLARLKDLIAENALTRQTDKTDKSPSVSIVSEQGRHASRDETAIEERAGLSADEIDQRIAASARHAGGERHFASSLNGEISDVWRNRIAPLLSRPCPDGVSPKHWTGARDGAERFAQQWAVQALRLGWTFDELFGLVEPFANVSLQGAAWFVGQRNRRNQAMPKGGRRTTSFKSGVSGNPSGRPKRPQTIEAKKIVADVKAAARERTQYALDTLTAVMTDAKAPPAARVSAATAMLDRGWGKPTQTVENNVGPTLADLVMKSYGGSRASLPAPAAALTIEGEALAERD